MYPKCHVSFVQVLVVPGTGTVGTFLLSLVPGGVS